MYVYAERESPIKCAVTGVVISAQESFFILRKGRCGIFFSQGGIDKIPEEDRVEGKPEGDYCHVFRGDSILSFDEKHWVAEKAQCREYLFSIADEKCVSMIN